MFKKLKDKIAEEVKISPQRIQQIQQFTQTVTDKLQPAGAQPDDGLFSISEDDGTKQSIDSGFINVSLHASTPEINHRARRNSNSSIASDVSFLPRYEPSMNSYHLQSDLDISASEVEDNASTQSSQLGHVSKEQVHLAFQKAQMRYHKYRGRYTDLANHYKELEHENAKMKAVLVETQDKAIRRASELKEQCILSQKAKADLEAALRIEIEEKAIIIDTLKQKVDLFQNNCTGNFNMNGNQQNDNSPAFTNGNNNEELVQELQEKVQELKANSIVAREQLSTMQKELEQTRRERQEYEDREKANNLKFAKSKMDLHTELQNRDLEITNLKQDVETLRHDLEMYESGGSLKSQNTNLIEKCEALTIKCHEYEAELLKVEQYKMKISDLQKRLEEFNEMANNIKELEIANGNLQQDLQDFEVVRTTCASLTKTNEDLKQKMDKKMKNHQEDMKKLQEETKHSLVQLQDKIKTSLRTEYSERETQLKAEFELKLKQLEQDGDSLKQTQIKLMQAEEAARKFEAALGHSESNLGQMQDKNVHLEKNYLNLMEENNSRQIEITSLMNQVRGLESNIESSGRAYISIQEEKNRLVEDLIKCESELATSQDDHELLQSNNGNLTREILTLNAQIMQLKDEKRRLEVDLMGTNADAQRVDYLTVELTDFQERFEHELDLRKQAEEELGHVQRENDEYVKKLINVERLLQSLGEEVDRLSVEKKETLEEKRKIVNELERNIKGIRSENDRLIRDYASKQEECGDLKCSLKEAMKKYENVVVELREQTDCVHKLVENVNEMKVSTEKWKTVEKENNSLRQRLKSFEKDREMNSLEITKQLGALNDENLIVKTENEKFQQEILCLKQGNLELRETSEEIAKVSEELVLAKEQNVKLSEENAKLSNSITKLNETIENLKVSEQSSQSQLENFKELSKSWHDEKETLNCKLEDLILKHDQLTKENAQVLEKCQKVENDSAHERLKSNDLNQVLQEKDIKINDLEVLLKDAQGFSDTLKEELKLYQSNNTEASEKLHFELVRLKDENQQQTNMLKVKEQEVVDIHRQLEQLQVQLTAVVESKERMVNELSECTTRMSIIDEEMLELQRRNDQLSMDNRRLMDENDSLLSESSDVKLQLATKITNTDVEVASKLSDVTTKYSEALDETKTTKEELDRLKMQMSTLDDYKLKYEKQFVDLEKHCNDLEQERQFLKDEIEELKTAPLNVHSSISQGDYDALQAKLVQYKSIDQTNRSSIEFYENELQKMHAKHEKLNRKLDETLVTLNHCADLSASTEVEYLKNVLYNYMLGKESLVLARVIAAVCKFDREQTDAVLKHEQHKQTLLGQLGIL